MLIYQGRSIRLEERDIKLRNGSISRAFPVVTHESGVIVVPIIHGPSGPEIMLIKQWRPAMGIDIIEVPGGGINKNELPEEAARREVMEEAGLVVSELIYLGRVFPAPGWDIETQDHFIAICNSELYEQPQDDVDNIERIKVSLSKASEMLAEWEIVDLKTRSILYDALSYLKAKVI